MSPFRAIKNLIADLLIWSSGTWVGSPDEQAATDKSPNDESADDSTAEAERPDEG